MQLSGVQAAALLLALAVFGVLGTMNGVANTQAAANSDRLVEIALSYGESIASNVKSGGSVTADTFTLSDNRLGPVSVAVSQSGSFVVVKATAQGMTRQAQVGTQ